ncbi:MAG: hypothetical protein KDD44_00550 [Bdellovibrionales bacterium]|nr:hypothetical protein [Bdellovibrionales bacterium]
MKNFQPNRFCFSRAGGVVALIALGCLVTGCATSSPRPEPVEVLTPAPEQPIVKITRRENRIPEGAVLYCWEEPMVEYQRRYAGVSQDGDWYQPSYISVREVRSGKWRPCRPGEEPQ